MSGGFLCSVASCARWHLHPPFCFFSVWRCFSESSFILFLLFLNVRIIILSRTHPCRQNFLGRDASLQDFSSLQTKSSRQGCIAPGFFIPADKISSAGMHRPEIFHPCRQNLLAMDASSRKFSSLQTESPRQGCIAPGFFILSDRIFSSGMHRLRNYGPSLPGVPAVRRAHLNSPQRLPGPPQSAELTSIHLNACRAYPDKAGSSDFQTAGFHSR